MSIVELERSIRNYCAEQNYSDCLPDSPLSEKSDLTEDLKIIFEKFYAKNHLSEPKLSFTYNFRSKLPSNKKTFTNCNESSKNVTLRLNVPQKKLKSEKKIPEKFLLLLDELCIDRKNAEKFYNNKNDWTFVKSDRKIFCAKIGCEFSTNISNDCLKEHSEQAHKWGIFVCDYDNCKYAAYNKTSFLKHKSSHSNVRKYLWDCRCDRINCGLTFQESDYFSVPYFVNHLFNKNFSAEYTF